MMIKIVVQSLRFFVELFHDALISSSRRVLLRRLRSSAESRLCRKVGLALDAMNKFFDFFVGDR